MKVKRYRLIVALLLAAAATLGQAQESEHFGRFGEVTLYRNSAHPPHVVLFVSGDGGWNLGVIDMAKALTSLDAMVVGIDIRSYLAALRAARERCLYPAADFEALSQYLQKKLDFPDYRPPQLVGYSSGATLVYAILAQAPPNTFAGGISMGFCPDLAITKTFCKGNGLVATLNAKGNGSVFAPIRQIETPWIAFQGTIDQVCDADATRQYVSQVKGAEVVLLPKVGHGFAVQKNWMPQFREAFQRLAASGVGHPASVGTATAAPGLGAEATASVDDLPVVEVPSGSASTDTLAFMASGDGGWAGLDKAVAEALAAHGVPVVGLNTLQYYWQARTPEDSARALERILGYYLARWHKDRVLLIGYSRGADVLAFMASRLPEGLRKRIDLIALLGPATETTFSFHFTDWLGGKRADATATQPEIEKLRGLRILCVYGSDEEDSVCPRLPTGLARLEKLSGGHHFDGDYQGLSERLLAAARP